MTLNNNGQTRSTVHNIGLAIWRLKCFYETFVQGSTAVIQLNFCAKNPPHRQAEKRYRQARQTEQMKTYGKNVFLFFANAQENNFNPPHI